jgi:hypothetical protein
MMLDPLFELLSRSGTENRRIRLILRGAVFRIIIHVIIPFLLSLLQNERRSEIERKIFWARMSGEIARKRSSATLRTISPGRRCTGYF